MAPQQCFLFLVSLIQTILVTSSADTYECGDKPSDVIFLLDSSNSMWTPNFRRQLDFVKSVVNDFQIGEDRMRVGLITFNHGARLAFTLKDSKSKDVVLDELENVSQDGGIKTYISKAIEFMRRSGFSEELGGRKNVTKIGILISDGQTTDPIATAYQGYLAKQEGIHMFAVGVGENVEINVLKHVASSPKKFYVQTVKGYKSLHRIHALLAGKTCAVTDPPTTVTSTTMTTPYEESGAAETFVNSGRSTPMPRVQFEDELRQEQLPESGGTYVGLEGRETSDDKDHSGHRHRHQHSGWRGKSGDPSEARQLPGETNTSGDSLNKPSTAKDDPHPGTDASTQGEASLDRSPGGSTGRTDTMTSENDDLTTYTEKSSTYEGPTDSISKFVSTEGTDDNTKDHSSTVIFGKSESDSTENHTTVDVGTQTELEFESSTAGMTFSDIDGNLDDIQTSAQNASSRDIDIFQNPDVRNDTNEPIKDMNQNEQEVDPESGDRNSTASNTESTSVQNDDATDTALNDTGFNVDISENLGQENVEKENEISKSQQPFVELGTKKPTTEDSGENSYHDDGFYYYYPPQASSNGTKFFIGMKKLETKIIPAEKSVSSIKNTDDSRPAITVDTSQYYYGGNVKAIDHMYKELEGRQPNSIKIDVKETYPGPGKTGENDIDDDHDWYADWMTAAGHRKYFTRIGCAPKSYLDLVFVVDTASSEYHSKTHHIWRVIREIISRLNMDHGNVRIQFVTECSKPTQTLNSDSYNDKNNLLKTLKDMSGAPRRTAELLTSMISKLEENSDAPRRRRVGIYLTDGNSGDIQAVEAVSAQLKKEKGIEMFGFGIGEGVDEEELKMIASCQYPFHLFTHSHREVGRLTDAARKISRQLCSRVYEP